MVPGAAMFLFLAAGAVALFAFLSVAVWTGTQIQERKTHDRYALLKALGEQTGENARHVLEHLREDEDRARARKEREERRGFLIGGLCTMATGIGLMVMFVALKAPGVWAVGLIPLLIGIVLTSVGLLKDKGVRS
jgi:Flp pilus assembly protein TadB